MLVKLEVVLPKGFDDVMKWLTPFHGDEMLPIIAL